MKLRIPAFCFFGLCLLFSPARSQDTQYSGIWEGSISVVDAEIALEHTGTDMKAVVILRQPIYQKDIYHMLGKIGERRFSLHHHSGHSFNGTIADPGLLQGKLRTKKGEVYSIEAERTGPLPEDFDYETYE